MARTIDVSLSHFAKFVGAGSPSARVGAVERAKEQYEPAHDYYKGLRDAILQGHRNGNIGENLTGAVSRAHPSRAANYRVCAAGYRKFVGRGGFAWIDQPRPRYWTNGSLRVRVNPELYAEVAGEDMVLKLVWSDQSMTKLGQRVMQHLLEETYARDDWVAGLVDVRRGVIVRTGPDLSSADPYLASEAAAFLSLWAR